MEPKREQAIVGLFVLVAAALLLGTVFALTGAFRHAGNQFRAYFGFAGGIEPGAIVRYSGGPRVGRVEQVQIDPSNPSRIEITFSVNPGTPIKTDSVVKITSLSALGDNFIDVSPGSAGASLAASGATLKSVEPASFGDITNRLNTLGPVAQELLTNLNARVVELKDTLARVNDLLNDRNRANISASLSDVRGMLEEDRPKIKTTLANIDKTSAKLPETVDQFKKALADADNAVKNADAMITEDRPELHDALKHLRATLVSTESLMAQLDQTFAANSENLDEIIDNMQRISENLRIFTEEIKTRPYTLIRTTKAPEHKPGGGKQR